MAKSFVIDEGERENLPPMPKEEVQKYLKNDGYDDRRLNVWQEGIKEYAFLKSLDSVEAGILADGKKQEVDTSPTKLIKKLYEDRIVVVADKIKVKESIIIVPESRTEKPLTGTVVGVGPGKADKLHLQIVGYMVNGKQLSMEEAAEHDMAENDVALPMYLGLPMPLKVGDRVLYGKYAGTPVQEESGRELLIMRLADVFGNI
jgi:co-chaperonin GroES (HSP10)